MGNQRLTDLSYLQEVTGGESEIIKEFIEIFIGQIEEFRTGLTTCFENQQWKELGELAHKAKASVMTFGLNDLGVSLKQLQLKTQQLAGIDTYADHLAEFEKIISIAEKELLEDLKNLK
ncbi:hypothetical protein [Gaoshiqia sp. Z1-71]|uniref:hypothetical protein n=1 Tax=Gaoshiqia hydrogeniformans TaxID=3290090 RepID=UPI003BF8EF89